jgi:hypothetical protein
LRGDRHFSDVTLACKDYRTIQAHKTEHSLLDKCLDFTRDMVMIGQSFTLKLNLGSDLNFSFEYHEKMNPTILEEPNIQSKTKMNVMKARKKVSPSTKKKNAIRREDFIK